MPGSFKALRQASRPNAGGFPGGATTGGEEVELQGYADRSEVSGEERATVLTKASEMSILPGPSRCKSIIAIGSRTYLLMRLGEMPIRIYHVWQRALSTLGLQLVESGGRVCRLVKGPGETR